MALIDTIQKDTIAAMKAKETFQVSILRLIKTALYNKSKDLGTGLTDDQSFDVLNKMLKQRKDSIEQYTKGNRLDLAKIEQEELAFIEKYLPNEATIEDIIDTIRGTLMMNSLVNGAEPTLKDFGKFMKGLQTHFKDRNLRVDGKVLSEELKKRLS
jgi:uncharacterized protein YqeY